MRSVLGAFGHSSVLSARGGSLGIATHWHRALCRRPRGDGMPTVGFIKQLYLDRPRGYGGWKYGLLTRKAVRDLPPLQRRWMPVLLTRGWEIFILHARLRRASGIPVLLIVSTILIDGIQPGKLSQRHCARSPETPRLALTFSLIVSSFRVRACACWGVAGLMMRDSKCQTVIARGCLRYFRTTMFVALTPFPEGATLSPNK